MLLVVGRALQGVGLGGEWGGSILLAGEWTHPGSAITMLRHRPVPVEMRNPLPLNARA